MPAKRILAPNKMLSFLDVRNFFPALDSEAEECEFAISAAIDHVERYTGRALLTQTWELNLHDAFPAGAIDLQPVPVQSVTSVEYVDADGDTQLLVAGTDYETQVGVDSAFVRPISTLSWPTTKQQLNAVVVTYVCGYGDTKESVPIDLVQLVKMVALDYYENRQTRMMSTHRGVELPRLTSLEGALLAYRVDV